MDISIKDLIKNNTVTFNKYRQQHLYYNITHDEVTYCFPVPIEDLQDATVNSSEKAITMMRYIRKAIDEGTFVELN